MCKPRKLPTDVHLGISDTLCRRGGIWVVSQILHTRITQILAQLTQGNIPKLPTSTIYSFLVYVSRYWTQSDCDVIFPLVDYPCNNS